MPEKKETLNLVVIGPKHAGKTVYLSTLANSPEVSLSDPATIELVSMHWQKMQGGDIPSATSGAISKLDFSFHCQVDSEEYNLDFTVPDYDGQFAEKLSHQGTNTPEGVNPRDIENLRQIIDQADGFIVFMPMDDDDVKTMEAMRHEIGSFIGILRKVYDENAKIPAPLIIAVNKWDKSPDFKKQNEDAAALKYIESIEIYKKLYDQLKNFFEKVTVIALSAYGHRTDSARPQAGKMNPYRVTEPVKLVVQDFFANLQAQKKKKKTKDNPTEIASLLLETKSLWKRWPGEDYDALLQSSLDKAYAELISQLQQAHNSKEYKKILQEAPQSPLIPDFGPTRQVEIEHLGEPHNAREKKERMKQYGIAAGVLIVTLLGCYLFKLNLDINESWHEVISAETQKQPMMLSAFITEYGTGAVSRFMASGELEQAREKLQQAVKNLQELIDEHLAKFARSEDSCKTASEARQLVSLSEQWEQSLSAQSMRRLEAAYENGNEICRASSEIEAAKDEESLRQAVALLSDKPKSAEIDRLMEAAAAKSRDIAHELALAEERERIAPVIEEFRQISSDLKLNELEKFIQANERDQNSEVQNLVSRATELLPDAFYAGISELLKEVRGFDGSGFANLQNFIAANATKIPLTPEQRANIQQALQAMMEKIDRAAIDTLPEQISSQTQLDNAIRTANEIIKARQVSLDGGLFEYKMPPDLEQAWSRKANILNTYINTIEKGLNASWTLLANPTNAVDLDCANLIARDARLSITFYGGSLPDQSPPDGSLRCSRRDGNAGYEFYFSGIVNLFNGTIRLTKNRLLRSDLSCTAGLSITANDLIALQNGQPVTKSLQNNCPGTAIKFTKR